MRQRSPLCVRSVQYALCPSGGWASDSRTVVASRTASSRSPAASAPQRGQSRAYIRWSTYQPSRVTGAPLMARGYDSAHPPRRRAETAFSGASPVRYRGHMGSDRRAAAAARLLTRVFIALDVPLTFRLWDDRVARVGARGESPFAIVVRSPAVLRRLLRKPTPARFGEAFIGGGTDNQGGPCAARRAGDADEHP